MNISFTRIVTQKKTIPNHSRYCVPENQIITLWEGKLHFHLLRKTSCTVVVVVVLHSDTHIIILKT